MFVADFFEKEHKNVVREIERLTASDSGLSQEFNALNFERITYRDSRGRTQRAYAYDKMVLKLLVMGFTGQKALKFKELYIKRFNEMEKFIKALVSARQEFPLLTANIKPLLPR